MSTPAGRPFGTLLVANRGEIALRVIRSAQALGLRTVAVYSSADRESPHVTAADTAVLIGPAPAAQSYLSVEAVIRAAEVSGAEAVHPGYGFLSERADFARAVVDAGLVFVGPSAAVVEQMGRKDHARELAERAGVPVLPVFADADGVTAGDLPVLVKAAAGGGGKGMRIVQRLEDLPEAVAAARREAAAAFGDDTLLVERFVERGRHVEVQVIGDDHGNVRHLYERDCSTQRRHQKVVEEAPAPTVDDALRDRLTAAAVALAREVGYVNAGTVEFLVDESDGQAYFLEMNTRLQVEHPVTEAVVRVGGQPLDLVALQLAVAMGEELPFGQDDVRVSGHAIETRVYAEDPYAGHLPQAGTATAVSWSRRARVESALRSGSVVTSHYDPMIAKVVVRGPDREAARQLMIGALDESNVLGLTTNLGHLRELVASDAFRDCAIDTRWLDRHPDLVSPPPPLVAEVFAAWAVADDEIRQRAGHPFGTADGWRLSGPAAPAIVELVRDGEPAAWTVSPHRARRGRPPARGRPADRDRRGPCRPARGRGLPPRPPLPLRPPRRLRPRRRRPRRRHHRRPDAGNRGRRPGRGRPGGPGGRRARRAGGDEDGAVAQGAVRRHGDEGRRDPR